MAAPWLITMTCVQDHSRALIPNEAEHPKSSQPCSQISEVSSYGHGFYLTPIGHEVWPGHTGRDPGVSARVAFSPTSDSSIVVLCNSNEMAFRVFRLAADYVNSINRGSTPS